MTVDVKAMPQLPAFDSEAWRRALAGLVDDESSVEWREDFREAGAALCFVLARFYNRDELDPVKLWERIGTAVATACEEVDDGDLDKVFDIALGIVKASVSLVAASEESWILGELSDKEEGWRLGFVRYLKTHRYPILIHGRRRWEEYKGDSKRLRIAQKKEGAA